MSIFTIFERPCLHLLFPFPRPWSCFRGNPHIPVDGSKRAPKICSFFLSHSLSSSSSSNLKGWAAYVSRKCKRVVGEGLDPRRGALKGSLTRKRASVARVGSLSPSRLSFLLSRSFVRSFFVKNGAAWRDTRRLLIFSFPPLFLFFSSLYFWIVSTNNYSVSVWIRDRCTDV